MAPIPSTSSIDSSTTFVDLRVLISLCFVSVVVLSVIAVCACCEEKSQDKKGALKKGMKVKGKKAAAVVAHAKGKKKAIQSPEKKASVLARSAPTEGLSPPPNLMYSKSTELTAPKTDPPHYYEVPPGGKDQRKVVGGKIKEVKVKGGKMKKAAAVKKQAVRPDIVPPSKLQGQQAADAESEPQSAMPDTTCESVDNTGTGKSSATDGYLELHPLRPTEASTPDGGYRTMLTTAANTEAHRTVLDTAKSDGGGQSVATAKTDGNYRTVNTTAVTTGAAGKATNRAAYFQSGPPTEVKRVGGIAPFMTVGPATMRTSPYIDMPSSVGPTRVPSVATTYTRAPTVLTLMPKKATTGARYASADTVAPSVITTYVPAPPSGPPTTPPTTTHPATTPKLKLDVRSKTPATPVLKKKVATVSATPAKISIPKSPIVVKAPTPTSIPKTPTATVPTATPKKMPTPKASTTPKISIPKVPIAKAPPPKAPTPKKTPTPKISTPKKTSTTPKKAAAANAPRPTLTAPPPMSRLV